MKNHQKPLVFEKSIKLPSGQKKMNDLFLYLLYKNFFFYAGFFRETAVKPSKTIENPINYRAFESRDDGLSNYV
jgi:hypothetical protein